MDGVPIVGWDVGATVGTTDGLAVGTDDSRT